MTFSKRSDPTAPTTTCLVDPRASSTQASAPELPHAPRTVIVFSTGGRGSPSVSATSAVSVTTRRSTSSRMYPTSAVRSDAVTDVAGSGSGAAADASGVCASARRGGTRAERGARSRAATAAWSARRPSSDDEPASRVGVASCASRDEHVGRRHSATNAAAARRGGPLSTDRLEREPIVAKVLTRRATL